MKTHQFTLTVTTSRSRSATRSCILCTLASRQPDGCSISLKQPQRRQPTKAIVSLVKPNAKVIPGNKGSTGCRALDQAFTRVGKLLATLAREQPKLYAAAIKRSKRG